MPSEVDPIEAVRIWPCRKCGGKGVIGIGGDAPLCPRCLGEGTDPDPDG